VKKKISVTLEVGPYLYRKRRDTKVDGGLMSFWCIFCESLGVSSIAHVRPLAVQWQLLHVEKDDQVIR
jgi:hypothetical protein